ncbi:hypothetical protein [Natronincola ferrireducens]|uniref:Ferrochelatase n=1 Tax=Natronincola ferrireducens TaxID=393762 RepID=A0A1G9BLV6_9FIRM|nr:hypothetical protein [Natronincola ferrireducens]SDK40114.1 ferrochelatase [Natronincola ferrireducens]
MKSFIKVTFITIIFTLALILNGVIERTLWVISTGLLSMTFITYKKNQYSHKNNYKTVVMAIVLGYILTIGLLLGFQYSLEEIYIGRNYVPNNKTAIVVVFQGEPSTYNIPLAIKNVRQYNSLWSRMFLPFHLFKQKLNYEKIEGFSYIYQGTRLKHQLREALNEENNFYVAYLYDKPYLSDTINDVILEGNQKIIIAPVLLSETQDFINIQNKINKLNLQQYRIEVKNTGVLWNSELMAKSFVDQINHFKHSPHKHNIGIILIGEELKKGQENSPDIKQDLLFREKIREFLIRDGYNNNKISLTFFNKKNIHDEIHRLMEYGVGEIMLVPTSTTLQQISHQLILQQLPSNIEAPYTVMIHGIDPWSFNDTLGRELINRIHLLSL